MAKEYVPIFFDWMKVTEELNDQEKGRLIDAIVLYASGGDWQDRIKGNERYLFPAFREQVNRSNQISEARATAGSKPKQTETNANKPEQTGTNPAKANEEEENKEKEEENIKRKIKERSKRTGTPTPDPGFDRFWEAYPKKVSKEDAVRAFNRIGVDDVLLGRILSAIQKQKRTAQWQEDGGRFVPYPATWLNGHRWEDEVQAAPAGGAGPAPRPVVAQAYEQREYNPENERPEDMLRRLQAEMEGA